MTGLPSAERAQTRHSTPLLTGCCTGHSSGHPQTGSGSRFSGCLLLLHLLIGVWDWLGFMHRAGKHAGLCGAVSPHLCSGAPGCTAAAPAAAPAQGLPAPQLPPAARRRPPLTPGRLPCQAVAASRQTTVRHIAYTGSQPRFCADSGACSSSSSCCSVQASRSVLHLSWMFGFFCKQAHLCATVRSRAHMLNLSSAHRGKAALARNP